MDVFIYALGVALILSCFLDVRIEEAERLFSFGIVRVLLLMPLSVGLYLFVSFNLQFHLIAPLIFSENVFSLIWLLIAYRLHQAILPGAVKSTIFHLSFAVAGVVVIGAGGYWLFNPPAAEIADNIILFPRYGQLYLSSLLMLIAVFFMAWRLEMFWRSLTQKDRWQYKYLVIGFFLACGSLFWCSSYRLLYRQLKGEHQLLLAVLLLIAWLFISYAVIRHRLLNRKLFVSRKVIYSAAAPIAFAGYLILLGLASMLMRAFGWSLPFIFQWLLIVIGLLFVVVLVFSEKVRATVKYFISTHFYVNKYEYRDEWVAFSSLLQGTLTEREVVDALHRILSQSLFTHQVMIWLGEVQAGFRLIDGDEDHDRSADAVIASDDPLVLYLKNEQYFHLEMRENTQARQLIISEKRDFFHRSGLVLMVPLTIGGQCVGLIGLGPEYTGGRYGRDDFDLLAALGSQAASAILAARTAEKLAQARETSAWDTLSAFVLHDLKNAATMLSLVKENAPAHIHKPEFQQDLLGSVDDALKRMHKVQERLYTLKGVKTPVIKEVEIGRFVRNCCKKLARKLPNLTIDVQCRQNLTVHTDPEIIAQILENLMLNALEAGDPGILAHVIVSNADHKTFQFEFTDSGPGIAEELLPDRLFVPFKTTKPNGSGIGLWQVKRLVGSLGGTIEAGNVEGGGAKFLIRLPIDRFPPESNSNLG